jgi:oligoribonuclease NrnB/cAMP/cGMP phosphodiesterase (DHH superfamily)
MRIFHLSHNDLDGYSCQLVTKRFFDQVHCFNSGYGQEIAVKLSQIEEHIDGYSRFFPNEEKLLLISDLNLTKDDCKTCDKIAARQHIALQLLDHHRTGEKLQGEFGWYYMDITRCGTKIVYDWCMEKNGRSVAANDDTLSEYVNCVNAYDLWQTENVKRFEFGKVLNRLNVEAKEISPVLFGDKDNEYRIKLLENACEFIDNHRYVDLDDHIIALKKKFFSQGNAHDTLDNLATRYIVELLLKQREKFTIYYGKLNKGILTYQVGNSSLMGNEFLSRCDDYSFFMDVSKIGTVSIRSKDKLDVSVMANELFGGGGHANAAGGRIAGFRDIYTYDALLDRIKPILNT